MYDREVDEEKELVEAAASLVRIHVSNGHFKVLVKPPVKSLNDFADKRAQLKGPSVESAIVEDADREAREELADARNYLSWRIRHGTDSSGANEFRSMALGHIAAAYHLIELADQDED
jgi:hypothetical protein